jgi:DNA-directed RNA polymerase omega subunit
MKDDSTLISEVLEKFPNKYMAVIVASKRARAINDGQRPLIKAGASKSTTIALAEIAEGIIVLAEAPEMEAAKKATAPEPETPEIEAEGEAKEEEKDKEEKQLLPPSDDSPETDKQDEQAEEDKQE